MRGLLLRLGVLVLAASCGGSDVGSDMTPDSDLGAADLISSPDLLGLTGCKGFIACWNACPPLDGTCKGTCFQNTTPSGMTRYGAAIDCAQSYCVGVGRCAWSDAQMTMVMSVPGDAPAICEDCLHDADTKLYGDACRNPGSADCTQTQCSQAFTACLDDLP
ncbi:MAG TPA: hypothetical protein VFF06_03740 [Polyangia bacterium]|nr:hypothetical protein [Polyangia bacterium]